MDSFASPNNILEFSFKNKGLSIPAKPAAILLFNMNTVFALSTSITGIPYIGLPHFPEHQGLQRR